MLSTTQTSSALFFFWKRKDSINYPNKTCSESGDQICRFWFSRLIRLESAAAEEDRWINGRLDGQMDWWMDGFLMYDWRMGVSAISPFDVFISSFSFHKKLVTSHSLFGHSMRLPWLIARRVEPFLSSEAKWQQLEEAKSEICFSKAKLI